VEVGGPWRRRWSWWPAVGIHRVLPGRRAADSAALRRNDFGGTRPGRGRPTVPLRYPIPPPAHRPAPSARPPARGTMSSHEPRPLPLLRVRRVRRPRRHDAERVARGEGADGAPQPLRAAPRRV